MNILKFEKSKSRGLNWKLLRTDNLNLTKKEKTENWKLKTNKEFMDKKLDWKITLKQQTDEKRNLTEK